MKAAKRARVAKSGAAAAVAVAPRIAPASRPKPWVWALGLFLALFVTFKVYGPSIGAPFLFDDRYLPFMVPGFGQQPLIVWLRGVRPFLMLTFWANYQLSGDNPYTYHVVNVLIHFANAVLAGLIVRKLLSWRNVDRAKSTMLALFAGALFLLHPLQTESVAYVASRSDNLSCFLLNAAFAVFLYRRKTEATWLTSASVLALFGLAALTKEHSVALPAVLLLADYFWNPGFSLSGIRRNWRLYAPMAAGGAVGLALVWRVLKAANTAGFGLKDLPWYQYFFTQCRAIWVYLRLFVLPYGQSPDHDFAISRGILDHGAIFGLAGLVALAVAAWIYRRRYPLASFGFFAFLILLAPTSSFVPIRDVLVERRTYLAFLGLLLIAMEFVSRWNVPRSTLMAALGCILAACAVLTYQRNQVWSSAIALWQDTSEKSPHKARPRFQLAFAYYEAQQCAEASGEYAKAAQLEKPAFDLYMDWALAANCAGKLNEALDKFQRAAALERSAHVYAEIGMVYGEMGKRTEALNALDEAQRLNPSFGMTYFYRGNLLMETREFDKASAEYQHTLTLDPNNQQARDALANAARAAAQMNR